MIVAGFTNIRDGHHDNSVALVSDGRLIFASTEERFSRLKHDPSFPRQTLQAALDYCGLALTDIEYFATGWTESPFYSSLFDKYPFAPAKTALYLFVRTPGEMIKYSSGRINDNRSRFPRSNTLRDMGVDPSKIIRLDHYESHAASAYYTSGQDQALAVCIDAMGPDTRGKLYSGGAYSCKNGRIELIEPLPLYASMGLFYSAITVLLGFKFNDGEWKTMGLAAYGDPNTCYQELLTYSPRFVNGQWHSFDGWTDYRIVENKELLLNTRTGRKVLKLIERHGKEQVAAAAQRVFEETLSAYFTYLLERNPVPNIVLAGGSFLNVKFNKLLMEMPGVESVYIHPHAGDGGIAAGSALAVYARFNALRSYEFTSAALGVEFSDEQIEAALKQRAGEVTYEKPDDLCDYVAQALTNAKVIGWFQGRAEWGPRALGQRSVMADPRFLETKERINSTLKNRDWFMPFAPAILLERSSEYFVRAREAPFMTLAFDVVPGKESDIPAAIHIDKTARPQTVRRDANPLYYGVIERFAKLTGVPVILNTSFNQHGLPIVNSPADAIDHLIWGCVDELAIGAFIVRRTGPSASPKA